VDSLDEVGDGVGAESGGPAESDGRAGSGATGSTSDDGC